MCSAISNCFRLLTPAILLVAILGSALSGCGSGEVRGRIAGKVTFQGTPLSEGLVFFSNNDKGIHMSGEVKPDGSYEIITAKGAGLPLGKYQVRVRPPLEPLPIGDKPRCAEAQGASEHSGEVPRVRNLRSDHNRERGNKPV